MTDLQSTIVRCASCAAALGDVAHADVVVCRHCRAENHVSLSAEAATARAQRFQVAAAEAKSMAADIGARSDALMEEYQSLLQRVLMGERELAPRALEVFEGFMRLQYAPTLHFYGAWDSDDPVIVDALREVDATVAKAVAAAAESLGLTES